jgi:hypothetical protein
MELVLRLTAVAQAKFETCQEQGRGTQRGYRALKTDELYPRLSSHFAFRTPWGA